MAHFPEMKPPEELKHMKLGERRDLTPRLEGVPEGGVIKKVLEEGYGDFYGNANDKVTLHYIGYIGTQVAEEYIFDSSLREGKKPFVFDILKGQVVRGFEMAVMTMVAGERAMITLDPIYAFGKAGAPPKIPADTPIMFDTKILSIEPEELSPEGDKSITKHVLKKGHGWAQAHEGGMMKLYIKGYFEEKNTRNTKVFIEGEREFCYGEGIETRIGIPEFIEEYLTEWKMDEQAVIKMKAHHCFGSEGCPEREIPPNTDLEFEIHMKYFEKVKDVWEMDENERMDHCELYKRKGNDYFQKEEFPLSRKFYAKVVDNLEFDMLMVGEDEVRRKDLLIKALSNLANVHRKEKNYLEAKRCCDKALEMDPDNVKALFHRAMANYSTKDYQEALDDFEHVVRNDPSNRAASNHVMLCKKFLKNSQNSERLLYQRMCATPMDTSDSDRYGSGMEDITDWDNSMAQGMMTLEQEAEAWGETLPPKGDNNHGAH